MDKERKEILEKLRTVRQTAQIDLKEKHGYENCIVKNVVHYNKKVALTNRRTKKKEQFDLCAVIAEDKKTKQETIFYYLNGKELDYNDLIKEYESPEPIKDLVDKTKENESRNEKEKDPELVTDNLNELEQKEIEEKEEEKSETKEDKDEKIKDILTGKIPEQNIYQTIDVNKAKMDKWTTVGKGFDLPSQVKKIAIARPIKGDKNALSSGMTIYFLGNNGEIIDNIDGKKVEDFFKIDDATGKNPMIDNNIKHELAGHAERNIGQTMRRFKSTENTNLYLSIEQKTVGQYHEVYVGGKTLNGNRPVEIQLETDNVKIQTSSKPQEEADIMGRVEGIYFNDKKQKEADIHFEHGDDEEKIPLENVDGNKETFALQCKYIPGTDRTWEELSDETDKSVDELQQEFGEKLDEGKEPEVVLHEIEQEAEKEKKIDEEKESTDKEGEEWYREGPWSSVRH